MVTRKVTNGVWIVSLALILSLFVFNLFFVTVEKYEVAVLTRFGAIQKEIIPNRDRGAIGNMYFKLPFIESIITMDARAFEYDSDPTEAVTSDKRSIVVDNYALARIASPQKFYEVTRGSLKRATELMDDAVYAIMREAMGRYTFSETVSVRRADLVAEVTKASNEYCLREYGIEILSVRPKRISPLASNMAQIFTRAKEERARIATQFRAEGDEEKKKIISTADKEAAILEAEAKKQASIIRGEADAKALKIYADAFGQDPEFYDFMKSLETYKKINKPTIFLDKNDPFLKYFVGH